MVKYQWSDILGKDITDWLIRNGPLRCCLRQLLKSPKNLIKTLIKLNKY